MADATLLNRLAFTGTWRDYQHRVHDAFAEHTRDRNLLLVSAPGSSKTAVGLEMLRRLGRPTLVLDKVWRNLVHNGAFGSGPECAKPGPVW